MLMGDNNTDDFDNGYATLMGDNNAGNFDDGMDSYEESLVEEGGYGREVDSESSSYSAEDSKEATDIDEQDEDYNNSLALNKFGDDDDYAVTKNQDDEEQGLAHYDQLGDPRNSQTGAIEDFVDDFEDEEDTDFDGDFEDEDSEEEDEDEDEIGSPDDWWADDEGDESSDNSGKKTKAKDYQGVINWKPGDDITLALLSQVWKECRGISQVRPMMDSANTAVMQVLNSTGPSLVMRLNNYINKFVDSSSDTIGSLLDLASKQNKRLTFTALSVVASIYTQQVPETVVLATLPTALQAAVRTNPLKKMLNDMFKIAVPLINRKYRQKKN